MALTKSQKQAAEETRERLDVLLPLLTERADLVPHIRPSDVRVLADVTARIDDEIDQLARHLYDLLEILGTPTAVRLASKE